MTIGISIDDLLKIDPWQYDNQQDVLNAILDKCYELNPWNPIDENTPKDRRLLLWHEPSEQIITGNSDFTNCTKWQELPAGPK